MSVGPFRRLTATINAEASPTSVRIGRYARGSESGTISGLPAGPGAAVSTMHLIAIAAVLFLVLVVCLEAGYRFGVKRVKAIPNAHEGFGTVEGAVFGLFGLLLSLSFFGAASRLDARRQLIVQEANAIASAYLRVDLLPNAEQPEARQLFRDYLDERIRISETSNEGAALAEMGNSAKLQQAIWSTAVLATKAGSPGAPLFATAINQMTEVARTKAIAVQTHLPELVFGFLIAASLLSGIVAGFGMARGHRNWLSVLAYASIVTLTIFVMLDMEYPRAGLIRIGAADSAMRTLRDSMR